MIVQENEDNVFDQHLLELALQQKRIQTRRTTKANTRRRGDY
ncbi:hypothetical protein [Shewanella sp. MEBiC00475]|nr:hypothetical protein [Shewanella sp. MEBiC00475]